MIQALHHIHPHAKPNHSGIDFGYSSDLNWMPQFNGRVFLIVIQETQSSHTGSQIRVKTNFRFSLTFMHCIRRIRHLLNRHRDLPWLNRPGGSASFFRTSDNKERQAQNRSTQQTNHLHHPVIRLLKKAKPVSTKSRVSASRKHLREWPKYRSPAAKAPLQCDESQTAQTLSRLPKRAASGSVGTTS